MTGRAGGIMRKLMDLVAGEEDGVPFINDVTLTTDSVTFQRLDEGKFVDGRFERNIRIDQPTHLRGDGSMHAHIYGRKGNQLVVVNANGTGSHGSKGRLHPRDADALAKQGFNIRADRIVEWWVVPDLGPEILYG